MARRLVQRHGCDTDYPDPVWPRSVERPEREVITASQLLRTDGERPEGLGGDQKRVPDARPRTMAMPYWLIVFFRRAGYLPL
jgi:hypothetical protein